MGRDFNRPPGTWREKRPPFHHGWLKGDGRGRAAVLPKARFQHCCVHVSRNISHKVRVDDRKEVCDDFKMVYQASSKRRHWKHVVLLRKNGKPVIQNGGIDPFERLPAHFL